MNARCTVLDGALAGALAAVVCLGVAGCGAQAVVATPGTTAPGSAAPTTSATAPASRTPTSTVSEGGSADPIGVWPTGGSGTPSGIPLRAATSAPAGSFAEMSWVLMSTTTGGRVLHVAAMGGGCDEGPAAAWVSETASTVTLHVLRPVSVPRQTPPPVCPAIAWMRPLTVQLPDALGSRKLLHATV